jgi:MAE_28990/MAE_18760-like HEPN
MMGAALSRTLLRERTREVLAYISFVELALRKDAAMSVPGSPPVAFAKDLTHSLKANTYLLLYNVVEATMTQAMDDIHREILASDAPLDHLHPKLFLHVLARFKAGKRDLPQSWVAPIGPALVKYWIEDYKNCFDANRNYLFSGNVDGMVIRDVGTRYGFATGDQIADAHLTHRSLRLAKEKRNALAHGEVSFRECGQEISITELRGDAGGLLRCLKRVVASVDDYLRQRIFLRPLT